MTVIVIKVIMTTIIIFAAVCFITMSLSLNSFFSSIQIPCQKRKIIFFRTFAPDLET